jgi:hypothetical protein
LALDARLRDKDFIALYLEAIAGVVAATGQCEVAATLWGAADELRKRMHITPHVDRIVYVAHLETLPAQLGEIAFALARARGRALSTEQAVSFALAEE